MKKMYWIGTLNDKCDICGGSFKGLMYDCKTSSGPWGNICHKCFKADGCSLGLGHGQKYEHQRDGKWLKTGG